MTAEDFIEAMNRSIEDKRRQLHIKTTGHLILQKTIIPNSTFKAYKGYKYVVWFYKDNEYYEVIIINKCEKVITGQEEYIIRCLDIELANQLFNLVSTPIYIQLIKGDYARKLYK